MKSRVYIKNLDYYTTEEDLEEYLKDFHPVGVLIPSHTIRFSNSRQKHLGIAYAEFADQATVDQVIEHFNGKKLHGRALSVKQHKPVSSTRATSLTQNNKNDIDANHTPRERSYTSSKDTIYIPRAHRKVTEQEIGEFFEGHTVKEIHIYKPKTRARSRIAFRPWYVSVFVTLDTEQTIEEVIESLEGRRLNDHIVYLKTAFQEKYDAVVEAKAKEFKSAAGEFELLSSAQTIVVSSPESSTEIYCDQGASSVEGLHSQKFETEAESTEVELSTNPNSAAGIEPPEHADPAELKLSAEAEVEASGPVKPCSRGSSSNRPVQDQPVLAAVALEATESK